MKDWQVIFITEPYFYPSEATEITEALRSGRANRVHIRKPSSGEEELLRLLEAIPLELRPRLSLHDHHQLATPMDIGGVHVNSRNSAISNGFKGIRSISLHDINQLRDLPEEYDYAFLSPIYPSISKPGYRGRFNGEELRESLLTTDRIIALGGVTPDRSLELQEMGFAGYAMLGAAWRREIRPEEFALQFITHRTSSYDEIQGAEAVLRGGCRWVQLRMKDASPQEVRTVALKMRQLCNQYSAVMILDDHVELVEETGADGVHLGRNDMRVDEARRILGPGKIIGATANTYADIEEAALKGADYIGLGPYRHTTTKKNLSQILGLQGYQETLTQCRSHGLRLPIVAIGGITLDDVGCIIETGVAGIAVSGALLNAEDTDAETNRFVRAVEPTYTKNIKNQCE